MSLARFGIKPAEADNYKQDYNNTTWFSLKDDGDTAMVRFVYEDEDDILALNVHEVSIEGRNRKVICQRGYTDPIRDCPLCEDGNVAKLRMFVYVYNIDLQEIQIWERGRTWQDKLAVLAKRVNKQGKPLCSQVYEITRNGVKGDMRTTYELYPMDILEEDGGGDKEISDLPMIPDITTYFALDKSFSEMEHYVSFGKFPEKQLDVDNVREKRKSRTTARRTRKVEEDVHEDEDEDEYEDDYEDEEEEEEEAPPKRRTARRTTRRTARDDSF